MSQLCKSVQYANRSKKFAQAKYAPTVFNSKRRYKKLVIAIRVLQRKVELGHFTFLFCRGRTASRAFSDGTYA